MGSRKQSREAAHAVNQERGSIMVGLLVILITVGGLASIMLTRSSQSHSMSVSSAEMSRMLFVAEAGLNLNYVEMEVDVFYVVKDQANFIWNAELQEFKSGILTLKATEESDQKSYQLTVQYRKGGEPVVFEDRTKPVESIDEVIITSEGKSTRGSRSVTASYGFEGFVVEGAIMSDMTPTSTPSGTGRAMGQAGHVVFSGDGDRDEFHVFGDILANGSVLFEDGKDGTVALNKDNIATYLASFRGRVETDLAGTIHEIPDFTKIGSNQQLFDLERLEAAARAGAGTVYEGTQAFIDDMDLANSMDRPLEGIIVITVDPSTTNPSLDVDVNITGLLVVLFADGTDPLEKLEINGKLEINAADLTNVVPSDETTYTTGYPGNYIDPLKKPSSVDISPVFENYGSDEDVPALVFNNGVLDINGAANVCGVVYGASFIEIENLGGVWQYFIGSIYGGGGILLGASGVAGAATMIKWDSNKVDQLDTANSGGGKELVQKGYTVGKRKSKK